MLIGVGMLVAPGPGTSATLARSPDCPSPPITAQKLARVMYEGNPLACFGGRLLTFATYVPPPPEGIGWAMAWSISPGWLDDNNGSMLWLTTGPTRDFGPGEVITAWVPPALGRCSVGEMLASCPFRWFVGHWTTVSAHFDGPVARTCRFTDHPSEPGFTKRDAAANCKAKLIVLSVGSVAPPDTAMAAVGRPDPAGLPLALLALATLALVSLLLVGRWSSHRNRAEAFRWERARRRS
jgi:hypothetical protein